MKGGLGVIRLRHQNEALLLKNLHKFFTKADIPWVNLLWTKYYRNGKVPGHVIKGSFWWRHILKLLNTFKGNSRAQMGYGDTVMFWNDMWNGRVLANNFVTSAFWKNKILPT
jgi:hypothetical protein